MTTAPTTTRHQGLRLWERFTLMWNERPELAHELISPRFRLHLPAATTFDPATVRDAAGVEAWVRRHRATFLSLRFFTGVGPFVDEAAQVVAGPWYAETSVDGSPRPVCGMDTIAFEGDRIVEYWTLSVPVPAIGEWVARLRPTG